MTKLLELWPKGRIFDFILNFLLFVYSHHRFPIRKWNFSDQIFWQKCNVRYNLGPLVTLTSDKHLMKIFVSNVIGERYCVPSLDVIDIKNLDSTTSYDQDVIVKPRHLSGFASFFDAGEPIHLESFRQICSRNHYDYFRELNYKYLPKGLIVEPVLYDNRNLNDIKLFYFEGELVFVQVDGDRETDHKRLIFDDQFCSLDLSLKYPIGKNLCLPPNMSAIRDAVTPLAAFFSGWVRIDCYTDEDDIRVGEITHCHGSSLEVVTPPDRQEVFENYIKEKIDAS